MNKENNDLPYNLSSNIIRDYAYKNGNAIYEFMDKFEIGKSNYGKIMDAAAKGKGVIAHRLYGHHLIFNFPLDSPQNISPFLEHIFSDLFTKQGIPIIPGEILENTDLLRFCDRLKNSWNFVNGFDILAGTIAFYKAFDKFKKIIDYDMSINDFKDFANTFGIGAIELAIAISTANPFLLIGAVLYLTSGVVGILNDDSLFYFKKIHKSLSIEFSLNALDVESYLKQYSIENYLYNISIEKSLSDIQLRED